MSLVLIAGIINGSFVTPAKFTKNFNPKTVWFFHSVFGLTILPILIVLFDSKLKLHFYSTLSYDTWAYLLIGGFIFGIGQVCFFNAIQKIGLAKSFAVNLGLSVVIGSMFVVIAQGLLYTTQGLIVSIAVLLILLGIIANYFSKKIMFKENDLYGWIFILFAGIASGIQNIVFYQLSFIKNADIYHMHLLFWVWPPFLIFAAIPMLIYFFSLSSIAVLTKLYLKNVVTNFALITIMGLFFTGSLYFYSKGMLAIPESKNSIGWPLFMISIIMTSQIWGYFFKEGKNENLFYKLASISLLIIALVLLSLTH